MSLLLVLRVRCRSPAAECMALVVAHNSIESSALYMDRWILPELGLQIACLWLRLH